MPLFLRTVQVVGWVIALSWTLRVLAWGRMLPSVPDLTQTTGLHPGQLPSMTVIVPARNEAENIAATLRSLLVADGVALQIIAVDDRLPSGEAAFCGGGPSIPLHDLSRRAEK
jgi:cellulose synthase/poly-beta-1,6-N-acetylglucosamine synthase-like glycosyltransferase